MGALVVKPALFHCSSCDESGGKEVRTPDIQLAKLALYQLSYTPKSLKFSFPYSYGKVAPLSVMM
jgi:hypothetical protein